MTVDPAAPAGVTAAATAATTVLMLAIGVISLQTSAPWSLTCENLPVQLDSHLHSPPSAAPTVHSSVV